MVVGCPKEVINRDANQNLVKNCEGALKQVSLKDSLITENGDDKYSLLLFLLYK